MEKGSFRKGGIHYSETFAQVVSFGVLLLFVGKFVWGGWHVHRDSIPTTFRNGDIDVKLYLSWVSVVYKLKKSLYGLKQTPRPWYEKLKKTLERFGIEQDASFECAFKMKIEKFQVVILPYVVDLAILCFTKD